MRPDVNNNPGFVEHVRHSSNVGVVGVEIVVQGCSRENHEILSKKWQKAWGHNPSGRVTCLAPWGLEVKPCYGEKKTSKQERKGE
jgi:hypothetical protein